MTTNNGMLSDQWARIAIQRLRTLQEKKHSLAKQARREVAICIEKGRLETARIKTENLINEDIYAELLELLELYCELLSARFGLLDLPTKEPDPGITEAANALIYAATRTEVKELHVLREMLMHKYGRDYSIRVMENQNNCVSERVTRKLSVETPSDDLVNAFLQEIAKGYKVAYILNTEHEPDNEEDGTKEEKESAGAEDTGNGQEGTPEVVVVAGIGGTAGKVPSNEDEDEYVTLSRRFEALKNRK